MTTPSPFFLSPLVFSAPTFISCLGFVGFLEAEVGNSLSILE
jgi:hypothetical protein